MDGDDRRGPDRGPSRSDEGGSWRSAGPPPTRDRPPRDDRGTDRGERGDRGGDKKDERTRRETQCMACS
ncbi:hypothetical protein SK128_028100 [Halocaridina rubra]|uniref:Uncharacterized protein n=1 Tax=Halocaridina rubra TaxID=373956 RepID=A0AAN8WLV1_HALRR